jgi:hypothetical protein
MLFSAKIIRNINNNLRILMLTVVTTFGTGCSSTLVSPYKINSITNKIYTFQGITHSKLHLEDLRGTKIPSPLGLQYVLLFLPAGRIYSENPTQDLSSAITQAFLLKRNIPQISAGGPSPNTNTPILKVNKFSLSAFDFLVLRKISCQIEAKLTQNVHGLKVVRKISGESAAWKLLHLHENLALCTNNALMTSRRICKLTLQK